MTIYLPFFNTETFFPVKAESLEVFPAPPLYVEPPPLITLTPPAPPSPAKVEPPIAIVIEHPRPRPAVPLAVIPWAGTGARRAPGRHFEPPAWTTPVRADWAPTPLYVAPAPPVPPPRSRARVSLIPLPSPPSAPPLPRPPLVTVVPSPVPVLSREPPLVLFSLIRETRSRHVANDGAYAASQSTDQPAQGGTG